MLHCIRQFVFDWQTLMAGLLALVGAAATVWVIRTQIDDEHERHKDAIYRKSLVARAQMPDALSELSHFTEDCVIEYDRKTKAPTNRRSGAVDVLKNAIEFIDNTTALEVFDLVSFYQVHNARLYSSIGSRGGIMDSDRLYDTTKLRCLTDRLFSYARNEVKIASNGKPTRAEMMTALKVITAPHYELHYPDRYKRVVDLITKRHE